MSVQLIAVTQPLLMSDGTPTDWQEDQMSVEEFIAFVARVSNPANQNNTLTATKLLKYLAKNKHWSPFEMVNVVMEINTTRDIVRQILRHRSFSFQEFSQRYADPTQLGFIMKEARLQDPKNRQNSIDLMDDNILKFGWAKQQLAVKDAAEKAYAWAIEQGIAKEVARVVLPEGLTASRLYMNGTLRSWIHYCDLRMKAATQKEHREVAVEAWALILKVFPSLSEVLMGEPEWDDKGNFIR
jgi:thymidylate synthase (FAD)